MVAFGAVQPHTEEDLTDKGPHVRWLAFVSEHCHRPVLVRAAFRRQKLAHQLVIGQVLAEGIAQPVIQKIHRLHTDPRGIRPNQIPPLHRPVIRVVGVLQQIVHQPLTLVGAFVGQERATHRHRWQHADQI